MRERPSILLDLSSYTRVYAFRGGIMCSLACKKEELLVAIDYTNDCFNFYMCTRVVTQLTTATARVRIAILNFTTFIFRRSRGIGQSVDASMKNFLLGNEILCVIVDLSAL